MNPGISPDTLVKRGREGKRGKGIRDEMGKGSRGIKGEMPICSRIKSCNCTYKGKGEKVLNAKVKIIC